MKWPVVTLADVGDFRAGFGFPNKYQGKSSGHFPFAKVGDISAIARAGGKYISTAGNYVDELDLKHIKAKPVPAGAIVFAKIGEAIRQNFRAITSVELLIDNNAMALVPNLEKVNADYLYHFMCKLDLYPYAAATTVPSVRKSVLEEIEIPLPPLAEQKRIAAILDKADAIRRKRQQAIQLADDFLRAVFLDMFGDPVTNPKRWETKALKDISRIQIGPFGTQLHKEDYVDDGIPLINPTHIVKGQIVPKSDLTISAEKHNELLKYHLKVGDIIMGRRGEMGRCAVVTEKESGWLCGTGSLFVRPNKAGIFSEYLNKFLSSDAIKSHLESESLGATMPNLNKTIVGNIQVPVPSELVLERFAAIKEKALRAKAMSSKFSEETIFDPISQKAFSGNL